MPKPCSLELPEQVVDAVESERRGAAVLEAAALREIRTLKNHPTCGPVSSSAKSLGTVIS